MDVDRASTLLRRPDHAADRTRAGMLRRPTAHVSVACEHQVRRPKRINDRWPSGSTSSIRPARTRGDDDRRGEGGLERPLRALRADALEGSLILVGPTLGDVNTGISIFEAPDEAAARRIMDEDPVIAGGFARGELRPFRVSLLRSRDEERAARDLAGDLAAEA